MWDESFGPAVWISSLAAVVQESERSTSPGHKNGSSVVSAAMLSVTPARVIFAVAIATIGSSQHNLYAYLVELGLVEEMEYRQTAQEE